VTRCTWRQDLELLLKCEHLQLTGSFKIRGALNRLLTLTPAEREAGVIAASTGNHGQGVALAAQIAGVAATVFVPRTASSVKLEAMRALGAELETVAGDGLAAELAARAAARARAQVFVSPYNDPVVIAGQGTLGVELAGQVPELDAVFVSGGGGGLLAGVAAALKHALPSVTVVACQPANAPSLCKSVAAGRVVAVAEQPTISDGTAGGLEDGSITVPLCRTLVDDWVLVSEAEIGRAMRVIAERERWIVEGAAGVALAGCLKSAQQYRGRTVAVVLCGRNVAFETFLEATAGAVPDRF
jgi:threonine dehydratase